MTSARPQGALAPAYVLFVLSGAAGLVYQVVWSRLLNQIFGVSAHAVTAVLATYLGGLALGAWILGPLADRVSRPLRLYGWLELGIGASAVGGTAVIGALDPLHLWAASRLAPDSVALAGVRAALASAIVLPPTILMGATLPAMTRAFVHRPGTVGRNVASLYALNTAGAVLGALAAGFVLVRALGVHPTLWLAAAANATVGAAALALSRRCEREVAPVVAPGPAVFARERRLSLEGAWVLAAIALSGFASLALEVLWTRLLVLVFGTSTYAFATMLATFLVGIALGSFLARTVVDRVRDPRRAFAWIQVGIAASTAATLPFVRAFVLELHEWFDADSRWLTATAARFGASFLVMIVPTILIGTTFPLAGRIWARRVETLGGRLGQVYGANTVGNILGAVIGGFAILPALGMQRGIALVALLNLVAAALAFLPLGTLLVRPRGVVRVLGASAAIYAPLVGVLVWRPPPLPGTGGERFDRTLYYREGLVSTVKVFQRANDGAQTVMSVDGTTIGQSNAGVDHKQQVLAHLPFLLRPDAPPRRVLSIGLGSGILIGEVAKHPGVERVECVEISPSVIEGARVFAPHNGDVLSNPRVRVVNDDGMAYLRRTEAAYDAIVSDGKSRSGHAGNALFYSLDYYRVAHARLAPDGIMLQWVPLDVGPEELKVIVRTFTAVFQHAYLWLGPESAFLAGLERPLAVDLAAVDRLLERAEFAGIRRHGWRAATDLSALLIADAASLRRFAPGDGPMNSLETPILEFHSLADGAGTQAQRRTHNLSALAQLRREPAQHVRLTGGDPAAIARETLAVGRLLDGLVLLGRGDGHGLASLEAAAGAAESGFVRNVAAEATFNVARSLELDGRIGEAASLYAAALRMWPELTEAHLNLGRILAREGRAEEALAEFRWALRTNPRSGAAHRLTGKLMLQSGDAAGAISHLREALRIASGDPELHDALGVALATAGQVDDALSQFRDALRLAPDWPTALERVALILATDREPGVHDPAEAIRLAERALDLTKRSDPAALEVAAAAYAAADRFAEAEAMEARVVELAVARGDIRLAQDARAALERYRRRLPLPGLRRSATAP